MNAAAGTLVNTKNPYSPGGFYASAPKAIGPRFGSTKNPPTFGKSFLVDRRR